MSIVPTRRCGPDALAVRPGSPLTGTVCVDGSKNAALPLLAAAAALGRPVQLSNVPASADVQLMLDLLQHSGYRVDRPVTSPSAAILRPGPRVDGIPELADAARIRASYYLVAPLLAVCGEARLPWPGGCQVGDRGMELHFKVYETFGDTVLCDDTGYHVLAGPGRDWVRLPLPFRSRGATIAAILRAVAAGSRLELGNPNLAPETTGVLAALRTAGWNAHASQESISLSPPPEVTAGSVAFSVPGDKIEAGTLACAIAATGGEGRIEGIHGPDLAPFAELLNRLGIPVTIAPDALTVHRPGDLPGRPLRAIATLEPDGLDADFEPPLMALALTLPGLHTFSDDINPGRHGNLLPQLGLLGAEIEELTPTLCRLTGSQRLTGAAVRAMDIRTGSALLIAALNARGVTTVSGLHQLRRGHADLPAKLRRLGADITEAP
ncbi:UDP-N-acetylglucosamine 1-carboxyvinyltransferase [Streptomyces sp. NPDC050085]|uniref:UDP-N-acetylglucosamine 1-carboxyvinyltransferase n=1 Tax=Streptomyces sp. NPDC050085 TaxID=3365600 RepID=UPI0037A32724